MPRANSQRCVDLSIPLDPYGPQPNAYGAPPASARPYSGDGFLLDTRQGGSCNCEVLTLIPHCNGTHTESVGHITRERFPLSDVPMPWFMSCFLFTVKSDGRDIRAEHLERAPLGLKTLVIRTLPNDTSKRTRRWENDTTPYFTVEAMRAIRSRGVQHLLVDLPSLDPLYDGGKLAAHRVFWDVPLGSLELPAPEACQRTVTEMIFVPDEVPDGRYLLSLQFPHIITDAVPSRPILIEMDENE